MKNIALYIFLTFNLAFCLNAQANRCSDVYGSRRDPNLKISSTGKLSTNNLVINSSFKVSKELAVLRPHFPDKPILPGVYLPHLALKSLNNLFSQQYEIITIPSFINKAALEPGSRSNIQTEVSSIGDGKLQLDIRVSNDLGKILARGKIEVQKKDTDRERNPKAIQVKQQNVIFSKRQTSDFLPHGESITFPFEITSPNISLSRSSLTQINTPLKISNVSLPSGLLEARVTIPSRHILLKNYLNTNGRKLPNSFIPEFGAQAALLSFMSKDTPKLPYNVLLREVKEAQFFKAMKTETEYKLRVEILQSSFNRSMLKIEFRVQTFSVDNSIVNTMNIVGLLSDKEVN